MRTQTILGTMFLGVILCDCIGCSAWGPSFQPVSLNQFQAVVYIYRPSGSRKGSNVGLVVKCDGRTVGTLWNKGYLYQIIYPGKHVISSRTEQRSEVPFTAKAGESYYIEAEVETGCFIERPRLLMVSPEEGKLAILGMRYSGSSRKKAPGQ